jgi:Fur family transcriptional regulator, ferric uptake regulator
MHASERSWRERATAALSDAGFRSGGGRRQVVDLLGTQDCALTALEIDKRLPDVGRATVYRALEQLESLGLIQRVDLGGDASGYEPVDPSGHHHHHIVCEHCGRVVPFEDEGLERAIVALAKRPDFNVSSHDVTLRGECASCGRESV